MLHQQWETSMPLSSEFAPYPGTLPRALNPTSQESASCPSTVLSHFLGVTQGKYDLVIVTGKSIWVSSNLNFHLLRRKNLNEGHKAEGETMLTHHFIYIDSMHSVHSKCKFCFLELRRIVFLNIFF